MKLIKYTATLVALGAITTSAFAVNNTNSFDKHIYMGVTAGYAKTDLTGIAVTKNSGFAGGAYAGYQISKSFSAELGYQFLPDIKIKGEASTKSNMIDLAVVYAHPIRQKIGILLKAGYAHLQTANPTPAAVTRNVSAYTPYLAAGVSFQLTPRVSTNVLTQLAFKRASKSAGNYGFLAGLQYHFA